MPLRVLTTWDQLSSLINSRIRWTQSYSRVERLLATDQEVEDALLALTRLKVLGWGSQISLYGLQGTTNLSLAQFLNDSCIDGGAINLMARFVSSSPTLLARIFVFDLRLSDFLSEVGS